MIREKANYNYWILFGIILVGAILRFYNYQNLPFSHDEISALLRTNFTSFSDLIEHGVMRNDFHPAGVQVFLYYWTQLFGNSTWIVKLPFTLMSIGSIYLVFQIGKSLRNETVGLILASILATTQYFIIYGSFARPYSSGLFFTLLLINSLLHLILKPEKKFWRYWVLFVLAGALCAYNHYFSMLVAGMIGLTGLFFVSRKILIYYVLAGVLIGLLYLPHLPITLFQLGKGGVGGEGGWLGPPTVSFFGNYFSYLFHYSLPTIICMAVVVIYGILHSSFDKRYVVLFTFSAVLFLTPLLLGYFYSVYVNPVLQFSVLIFSALFFYLTLFGHFRALNLKKNVLVVTIILISNIFSLVVDREHFKLYYSSIYDKINADFLDAKKNFGSVNSIAAYPNSMEVFYSANNPNYQKQRNFREFQNGTQIIGYLDSMSKKSDYFYLGTSNETPINLIPQIQLFFPTIEFEKNYFGGSTYLFSKKRSKNTDHKRFQLSKSDVINKTTGFFELDSITNFSPSIELPLKAVLHNKRNFIDITLAIEELELAKEIQIVTEIRSKDSLYHWASSSSNNQYLPGKFNYLVHSIELFDLSIYNDSTYVKVFVWNLQNSNVKYSDFIIKERIKNPYLYGLLDPIEK